MRKQVLASRLPHMPPPAPSSGSNQRGLQVRRRDYTPVYWDTYFHKKHDVQVGEYSTFRVYECGTEGPVIFFLHGGGYSALSWALLSSHLCELVHCRCIAVDLRGHGDTSTDSNNDLSAEILSSDVGAVIKALFEDEAPPVILIGHSMGGAIAVHTAVQELVPTLAGLVVIDVVEGTAMEALSSMQSFLRGRPSSFKSLEEAIEWSVRSGQVRNLDSARVSIVGQVKSVDTGETATCELQKVEMKEMPCNDISETIIEEEGEEGEENENSENTDVSPSKTSPKSPVSSPISSHVIRGDSIESSVDPPPKPKNLSHRYTWRIDLSKTDKYWTGWFKGLSEKFLSCNIPKLLLLAGVDRLDKDLTIGQMQGKFQMQVLPQCGHAVHEDVPDKVADVLATFLVRHKMATPACNFQRTFPAC